MSVDDLLVEVPMWKFIIPILFLGAKLRELMLQNNMDFGAVEIELKKVKTNTFGQRRAGQWVTKHYLMTSLNWTKIHVYNSYVWMCNHGYSTIKIFHSCVESKWVRSKLRKMADNAFDYAAKNNLLRTNEIHQEQEAKLVLEDGFTHERTESDETTSKTSMMVEDTCLHVMLHRFIYLRNDDRVNYVKLVWNSMFFFKLEFLYEHIKQVELAKLFQLNPKDPDGTFLTEDSLPSGSSSRLDLLRHGDSDFDVKPEDAAAASSGSFKLLGWKGLAPRLRHDLSWTNLISHGHIHVSTSLRLVFPTIQENTNAVGILPHFIEVCGRKIDNTAAVLDWLSCVLWSVHVTSLESSIPLNPNHDHE